MSQEDKNIPIEWHVPEGLPTVYANNVVVQHTDSEFIVSFFQAFPPLLLGDPEQVQKQVEALEAVRAQCVAKIVITPAKMETIIGALVQNYTRFLTKQEMMPPVDEGDK